MTTTQSPSTTYTVRPDEGSVIAPFVVLSPTGCRVGSWLTEDAALRDAEQRSRVAAQKADTFPLGIRRERGDWIMETNEAITDEQAARITWRADARDVVLGAYVQVTDASGVRAGHLSSATYHERWNGPAYVVCALTLR